jgi:uncharacterized RDD family membrane protein YckC
MKIPARGRRITQETQVIAAELLGKPLSTFRRRLLAFLLDVILFGLVVGTLFAGLSYLSIKREFPTFFPSLQKARELPESPEGLGERRQLLADFLRILDTRCPEALPRDMKDLVVAEDWEALKRQYGELQVTLGFGSGPTRIVETGAGLTVSVGTDLLLGSWSSVFSWGAFFVGWFTLLTRLGRGRTPGKWLLRIRAVRLDGKPLSWWDAFGRSGGYGASAATLFLGFLEAVWHPNRQAMHDRIAGTVVMRS